MKKDNTDRNRTSPFAFTGNKFEFRMVGSAASIAGPNVILNAIVAEALEEFADKLEAAADFDAAVVELVRETVIAHKRIIFNGDGYTDAWVEEAKSRGLLNSAAGWKFRLKITVRQSALKRWQCLICCLKTFYPPQHFTLLI